MADLPPPDLMSPPSDLVGGGPPPDLVSPPDDLQDVPQGQGSVSRETPIAPQKATLAAPMAAMGPGDYTSLTKGSYYVGGDGGIYQKGTAPGGKDAFIKKPTVDTGLTGALTEGIKAGISGVKQTGQSLAGQAPTDLVGQPQSLASQPMTWGDFVHPAALAQKTLYSLAQGSPTIAGGIAGGMAGAAIPGAGETGIPEVAGGALGAGAGSMVQSLGPYYAAALKANPGNPDAAFDQALKQAGTEGAISGVGWAAFGFAPFKRAVSNLLLQAFGVQPSITAAGHAVQNVEAGRPAGEGVAQDIPGSVVSTIIPAAGHAAFHAAARAVPKANDILENIASGKPANAPPEGPPSDLQPEPPQGVAPAQTPSQAPQTGDAVGLRFKSGPPQRGTVDHYFDNGNAVRLRMDDGSVQDITTADFLRNRAEPPQPMQPQGPATHGPQLQPDQRPTPPADIFDQWDQPQERPPAPRPAPLGGDMLNALDHADSLEKTALNGTLKLSAASRQDMLTEAARLRRLVGQPGEQNVPPNAYAHPLAGEPAADLGELAAARVAQPGLYQGDYGRTTPESPKTLQIQQDQLVNGDRQAMLFPANAAAELPLPPGMARTVTPDGIFHFDPNKVAPEQIAKASQDGTLNSVLNLGPYSKNEVMARTAQGEKPLVVVERAPDGTEIRAAAGTDQTAADQLAYFNSSKAPDSTVGVEDPQAVIQRRLADKPDPYALEDVARSRQPLPKAPSLFDRIRELGGIKDDGQGDVNQIMRDYRRPGMRVLNSNEPMARRVVRPDGLSPERIRAALQGEHWWGKFEDQYGPDAQPVGSYPGDDIRDLYKMMDKEARGEKVYHPDSDIHQALADRALLDQDLTNAGATHDDPPELAARKLTEYRQSEKAAQDAWERQRGIYDDLADLPPADQTILEDHGYEPGSDVGAEHEEPGGHEEDLGRPPPEPGGPPEDLVGGEHAAGVDQTPTETPPTKFQVGRERVEPEGGLFATEPGAVDGEGRPLDQTIVPGAERSAQQLAQAREAAGHGRIKAKVQQKEPGGLFAEPDKQGSLFQKQGAAFGKRGAGETVKLADDIIGRTLKNPSPDEVRVLNQVEAVANRIVPRAKVNVMRDLRAVGQAPHLGSQDTGMAVTGATYMNGLKHIIAVSLEGSDAVGTLRHEAVHYLVRRGIITPKEWSALDRNVTQNGLLEKHNIEGRYPGLDPADQREEAIAEEMAFWRRAPNAVPKMFRPMYERVSRFIAQVGDAVRRVFGQDVTANDVMSRIMSGEIGSRTPADMARMDQTAFQAPPANPAEAADRRDSAADAMADQLRSSPPGTYARTLAKMQPPSGDLIFKDPNAVQNFTIRPETLARMDTRSAAVWNAHKAQDADANAMVDDLRERIAKTMLKLSDTQRKNVYAARELDRINGLTRQDTGHQIVARNDGADFAHFSKPGQVVTLSPDETTAYHSLTDMFDRSWKNVMEGAARKVGWEGAWDKDDMAKNIAALRDVTEHTADKGTAKTADRAAKIVSALDEQRRQGYHPLMRFGDYFAHVTPKIGTDMTSTGGFPKTVRFELAERGLGDDLLGGTRVGNQAPGYAKEMIDRLQAQYPADKFNVEHGFLAKNPDMLDRVDIPAIEKLMTFMENDMLHGMRQEGRARGLSKEDASAAARQKYDDLYGALVDKLWDKAFKELESGYKKKSNTIAGYSPDFDRALGTYMHWTSRNVADQVHRSAVDDAHTAMETDPRVNSNVKKYWQNWRDYQRSPSNVFNKAVNGLARWGFLTSMGVNPSSTAVVGTHGLFMAGPTLSVGVGMGKAAPAYSQAMSHAMSAVKVDREGIHIPDATAAGRTPAEKAFLKRLDQEGILHSRAIEDMAALTEKQSDLWGSAKSQARKFMDVALSNVSFMDRANRIASALSAYRLAGDPKTLSQMDAAWKGNQIWRERASREGVNQESMAKFMVPNMVGEYGKMNNAPIERNAGTRMMMGMHGFVTRLLSNMWKLGTMGPQGRQALLWTAGAFWMMAGLDGEPFVQDAQNAADFVWKAFTKKDPMIAYRIQAAMVPMFGKVGSDMLLHGPVSALSGVDVASRLGMGDLISRNWPTAENTLGAYPSIIWGRVKAAQADLAQHEPGYAAAEFLPGGLHNAARAARESEHGVRTRTGRVLVPANRLTPADTAARAAGFTPEKVEHAYQQSDFNYRRTHSKMYAPPNPIPYAKGGRVHEAAAKADPEPSSAQIESGNYRKGHVSLHGFDISIETPKGAARRGVGADGKPWENRHASAHYGYIKRTVGADSEHVDCYIGPHHDSRSIYIVDQFDPRTRKWDEHKVVFGARTIKEAKSIYDGGFSDGSGPRRRRHVHETSPDGLKDWLDGAETHRPFAEAA